MVRVIKKSCPSRNAAQDYAHNGVRKDIPRGAVVLSTTVFEVRNGRSVAKIMVRLPKR